MADKKTVLVTGGSGFIGAHILVRALEKGYSVRTTVRSLSRSSAVKNAVREGGIPDAQVESIQFFEADLLSDKGWDEATAGCDYVLHVASPFPSSMPENEDELIKPAREGTLRALRAAKRAGSVKRVVVTSSVAAVAYGHGPRTEANPFTEKDWTEVEHAKSNVGAYEKSKTLAEKAAWQWLKDDGGDIELATVNPVVVCGPSLGKGVNTSLELPKRMLNGEMPGLPHLSLGIVDVRDVADLHMLALESPNAAGQRYIAISDEMSVSASDMARYFKEELPANESRRVPGFAVPNFLVKLVSPFDKSIRMIVPELGVVRPTSNAKAKNELGWKPRSAKDALLASAEGLKKAGLIKT